MSRFGYQRRTHNRNTRSYNSSFQSEAPSAHLTFAASFKYRERERGTQISLKVSDFILKGESSELTVLIKACGRDKSVGKWLKSCVLSEEERGAAHEEEGEEDIIEA